MTTEHETEVAIVGGGPAGAALATRLAAAGREVTVFERWPTPRWRASGVYSSPRTRRRLADLGLSGERLDALVRPIPAMVVESLRGSRLELRYDSAGHACGVDRVRLEAALLERARVAGAVVREGAVVRSVDLAEGRRGTSTLDVSDACGGAGETGTQRWHARLVVGADGPNTLVGRAAGLVRDAPIRRAGLTLHHIDPDAATPPAPKDARMVIGDGWYCGIAPVPGGRVNIGIVLDERMLRDANAAGAAPGVVVSRITRQLPGRPPAWRSAPATDGLRIALPLAHRVRRASTAATVLVGDAAGFIDPISGEGIHRALAGAELAATAIARWSQGEARALEDYDRHLRARYRTKDVISWLLQVFLGRPALLDAAVRRLGRRDELGRTFALVLADLERPSRALDPRFLVRLLSA